MKLWLCCGWEGRREGGIEGKYVRLERWSDGEGGESGYVPGVKIMMEEWMEERLKGVESKRHKNTKGKIILIKLSEKTNGKEYRVRLGKN